MRVAADANTVLSGLFFHGNERRLLLAALSARVQLVLAEDVVEEVYEVVTRTFGDDRDLPIALEFLEGLLGSCDLVPQETYAAAVDHWQGKVRDPADAPVLACAHTAGVDGLVTGDRDLLDIEDAEGLRVYRTREILARIRE